MKAINKVKAQLEPAQVAIQPARADVIVDQTSANSIFVKSEKKIHQVKLDEVLYFESYGSYVKIHLPGETILTLERLSNFEKKLPASLFIRVHKSYIVPVHQIKLIEGNRITIGDVKIPIGQVYKMNVNKLIE